MVFRFTDSKKGVHYMECGNGGQAIACKRGRGRGIDGVAGWSDVQALNCEANHLRGVTSGVHGWARGMRGGGLAIPVRGATRDDGAFDTMGGD